MLLIRIVLVPFWQGLPAPEFRAWFTEHSPRLRRLMVPLAGGAALTSVGAAAAQIAAPDGARGSASMAAAAGAGVVAVTLAVNGPANRSFVEAQLTDQETKELLARWKRWHDVRVALGLLGAVASARALSASRR
jgi:hypothetical protein